MVDEGGLRFCIRAFSGTTQICLFSLASYALLFRRFIICCLNETDHAKGAGAKKCGSPVILRFEPRWNMLPCEVVSALLEQVFKQTPDITL